MKKYLILLLLPLFGNMQLGMGAKAVADKLTTQYGGIEKWRKAPSVQFSTHLHFLSEKLPDYYEEVTVHPLSRKAYVNFRSPNETQAHAQVAYTGELAWSVGKRQGFELVPPRLTAWRNFFLFNIPFLLQDDGVQIAGGGNGTLPTTDKNCIKLKMTFAPGTGDTPKDFYILYVSTENYRLEGIEYAMTYASLGEQPVLLLIFDQFAKADGFIVPTAYRMYKKEGLQLLYNGEISDWHFDQPFDDIRMTMPDDAELDRSKPK